MENQSIERAHTMQELAGKVAVITGGASGIGLAVGRALAARGAKLVLADIEEAALEGSIRSLQEDGASVIGAVTDVTDRASVEALAERAWSHFGAVDLVMNNAGVAVFGPTQEMTHQDWQWSLEVNLWGPIHGVECFVPRMITQGRGGHVLFTASFAGLVPNRELGPYNVTKAAVVALAESLRKDVREHGIGVSVLCPMRVTSNIDFSARNRPASRGGPTANRTYTEEERAALDGRMLDVEPVAELVLEAILRNDLYIHTHREAEAYFAQRSDRITQAFRHAM
ncbi:MAG: SDR family NAD(P)-dependent oxidoreductase [Gammaproteobacteria bacterium]|jgi:NAD(P)-dependent dehydrogenase (short-subunit alcohol dehydrogenase family)